MTLARSLAAAAVLAATTASAAPAPPTPAAALCIQNGAIVTTDVLPNGGRRGICVFPNGTRIDENAYFRNKHRTQH